MPGIAKSLLSASLALAMAAQPALSVGETPFFRFSPTGVPPSPGAGSNDSSGESQQLAFASGSRVPSGTDGSAVSGAYRAKGGTPSYTMALEGAPATLSLSRTGNFDWVLTGTLSVPGNYPNARIVLTDSTGGTAVYPIGLTVYEAGAEPEGTFAFSQADDIRSNTQRISQTSYFSFDNGSPPYSIAIEGMPATASVRTDNAYATDFQIVSAFQAPTEGPGDGESVPVSGARVKVTDSRGRSITHAFPDFLVYPDNWEEIVVGDVGQPPSTLGIGQRWEGPAFTVTGNSPYRYAVSFENGPGNAYVEDLGSNSFRMVIDPTKDDAGIFGKPFLDVSVPAVAYNRRPHKYVQVGGFQVIGAALAKVSDFQGTYATDLSTDFAATATFTGGSGSVGVAVTGAPPNSPLVPEITDLGDGTRSVALKNTWGDAGSFPINVTLTDLRTQERMSLGPFTVNAAAAPLRECTGMPGGTSALRAIVGRYAENPSAVTFKGGVAPYTLTANPAYPAGIGLRFGTDGVGTDALRTIKAELEPDEVGDVLNRDAVLRDGTGSTCTVKINAKAAPVPTPDPNLALTLVPDTRTSYDGTVYTSPSSTGTRLISNLSAEELVRRRGRGYELCSFCLGYFVVPPQGKSIATTNPVRYYGFKQGRPLFTVVEYKAGSSEQPDMMRPILTYGVGPDDGRPSDSGTYLDVDRLILPFTAGVWTYRLAVEFEDETAGLTPAFTVEVFSEGTN